MIRLRQPSQILSFASAANAPRLALLNSYRIHDQSRPPASSPVAAGAAWAVLGPATMNAKLLTLLLWLSVPALNSLAELRAGIAVRTVNPDPLLPVSGGVGPWQSACLRRPRPGSRGSAGRKAARRSSCRHFPLASPVAILSRAGWRFVAASCRAPAYLVRAD
jgi:hypothetical protein